jgi:thioesterase domain-containing protein
VTATAAARTAAELVRIRPDERARAGAEPAWVVRFHPEGTRPPLFCACAADGNPMDYADLAQALPDEQPTQVFGVPPQDEGNAFPSIERLAAIYIAQMRAAQPTGPYNLCGHSFGGLVVYEMAVQLAQAGERVGLLALIDTLHPRFVHDMSRGERLRYRATYLADRLRKYARNFGTVRLDRAAADILQFLSSRGQSAMWRLMHAVFGKTGWRVPEALRSDRLVIEAAWHSYQSKPYAGHLVLLSAADRPPEYGRDRTLGWRHYVTGPIEILSVEGEHVSIMKPPHVRGLADQLRSCLATP